jgi:2-keto-4-pentenoate hydratase/2-oxohepta-3-ene-1,7-dioic acid hydratase in catechol pathway
MRLANFSERNSDRRTPRPGLVIGDEIVDLSQVWQSADIGRAVESNHFNDTLSLIKFFPELRGRLTQLVEQTKHRIKLDDAKLAPPIERPGKLICLAGNYREHIEESGFAVPDQKDVITQQLFLKPATAIIGHEDQIVIGDSNVKVGWETELAVVIGKRGRNITANQAIDHVFGYTILNDVSERGLNSRITNRRQREMDRFLDWLAGKWFDTFAPCGPWIVTADEVEDPQNLDIKLTVNGELRQRGNTRDMIFSISEQIAYASSIMTLEPGDIISTGTPVGAGLGDSKGSLSDGDQLVCEIQKIGSLKNSVRCTA